MHVYIVNNNFFSVKEAHIMVSSTIQLFNSLMGEYYKSLSVAAIIIISNNIKCPMTAEQVVVIFMTSLVIIGTVELLKHP